MNWTGYVESSFYTKRIKSIQRSIKRKRFIEKLINFNSFKI